MTRANEIPSPSWPQHPDGSNKKIGEMTQEERNTQVKATLLRIKAEIESPAFAAALFDEGRS